jgi:uncharacterized protein YceK
MKQGRAIALLLGILPVLSGCGTLRNLPDNRNGADSAPRQVYGGVQIDVRSASYCIQDAIGEIPPFPAAAPAVLFALGTYTLLVDLPVTAIGDTLTLPYVLLAGPGDTSNPILRQAEALSNPPTNGTPQ